MPRNSITRQRKLSVGAKNWAGCAERVTAGKKVDDLGYTPYDYLNNAQKRIGTSQGEKLCSMKSHDFIWAKSEMQGFRDDMEDSYS